MDKLIEWMNSPQSSAMFVYILVFILIASKIYLRFFKNRKLHINPTLRKKICPFCNEAIDGLNTCKKCNKKPDKNQLNIACYHCGYLGEMDNYSQNSEFWVTVIIWGLFTFPAIIYYFLYHNKKICRNCGRMTRASDYKETLINKTRG